MTMLERVVVRVRRPGGTVRKMPSAGLNQAMVSLADSEEMRPLLREASAEGKALAIDVYQNRSGRPLLVHFSKECFD
jgi:hypothetical protein